MAKTKIDYVDYSWNPILMKCKPVSEACTDGAGCWHLKLANGRLKRFYVDYKRPVLQESILTKPLHYFPRKKPRRVAVQFMGDLWEKSVPRAMRDKVMEVVDHCNDHTFLFLTKRPERIEPSDIHRRWGNCWFGVTVELQKYLNKRLIPFDLLPPCKIWLSLEPLLGPIDLRPMLNDIDIPEVHQVVVGCQSGPGRISCDLSWIKNIVDICYEVDGLPCFVKQIPINNRVSHDPSEWPKHLRVRQQEF